MWLGLSYSEAYMVKSHHGLSKKYGDWSSLGRRKRQRAVFWTEIGGGGVMHAAQFSRLQATERLGSLIMLVMSRGRVEIEMQMHQRYAMEVLR